MKGLGRALVGLASVLACGGAHAWQGGVEEIPVAAAADVRAACAASARDRDAVRATARVPERLWVVTLPADAYRLAPYDEAGARLPIDARRGFRPRDRGYELVIGDLAGGTRPALPRRSPPRGFGFIPPARDEAPVLSAAPVDLALPATPAEARALTEAHREEALALTLWFRPVEPTGDTPACARVHAVGWEGVRLAIEVWAFELSSHGERIAAGRAPALADAAFDGAVEAPHVEVAGAVRTTAAGAAPRPVAATARGLAPRLLGCYRRGLAREPALRGSLVTGVELAADGRVVAARLELEGLGAPRVTGCVLDRLRAARFPRGHAGRYSIPIRLGSAR